MLHFEMVNKSQGIRHLNAGNEHTIGEVSLLSLCCTEKYQTVALGGSGNDFLPHSARHSSTIKTGSRSAP